MDPVGPVYNPIMSRTRVRQIMHIGTSIAIPLRACTVSANRYKEAPIRPRCTHR